MKKKVRRPPVKDTILKAFKHSCGARFSERVPRGKNKVACRGCKGIATAYKTTHKPPIYKTVTRTIPTCPSCGSELKRATGDVGTMFDWQCKNIFCNHVC